MNVSAQVWKTVKEHNLISEYDRILVGLSGGADSSALLHILSSAADKYNITLAAAHINHMLRPTADRDMEFCRKLCERLNVEFHCIKCDVKSGAKNAGIGEEEFARNLRYEFFTSLGYDKTATAHNKNDAAETVLFHFIRGASLDGLSGIPYKRENIIRPLLDVTKNDIYEYCRQNNIEYVTDETNFQPMYTRNKLRLKLIPEIESEYNPAFTEVITQNSVLISEDSRFLDELAQNAYNGQITADDFFSHKPPIQRRLIQIHYRQSAESVTNLSAKYIAAICDLLKKNKTGSRTMLPGKFEAVIEYGKLIIRKKYNKVSFSRQITPEKVLNIPEIGKNILIYRSPDGDIYLNNTENLIIRNRRTGDYFYPVGMSGKKKLSDYFTDKKIPLSERDRIPLLTQNGKILSVIGLRNGKNDFPRENNRYKIDISEE